jgi:hypothetical protein
VKGDYFTAWAPAGIIRCLEAHDLMAVIANHNRNDRLGQFFLPGYEAP